LACNDNEKRGSVLLIMAIPSNRLFSNVGYTNSNANIPGLNLVSKNIPYLKPNGSGLIDILNEFTWSNSGDVSEVPYILVTESELQYGAWVQNIANALVVANATVTGSLANVDPYLTLYAANPTGFSYAFPWLISSDNPKIRSFNNQWDNAAGMGDILGLFEGKGDKSSKGNQIGAGIAALGGVVSPGMGIESTYQYTDTALQEITISFPLYNTFDTKSAFDNYCFVTLFTFQNLKNRTSFITYIPPKIYTLDGWAFGGIYWPAAYVSNLDIQSIGTTRYLSETGYTGNTNGNALLVPEAYKVSITFKQLLPDSSNIFAGTMGGTKVQVVNPLNNEAMNVVNKTASTAAAAINGVAKTVVGGAENLIGIKQ